MEQASKTQKVLISGLVQSNFIKQLYHSINILAPAQFLFDLVDLKELSGKNEFGDQPIFNNQFNRNQFKNLASVKFLFSLRYIKLIWFLISRGFFKVKFLISFTKRFLINANLYQKLQVNNYDLFHFHFPRKEYLDLFWHLREDDKSVISFWGSDLLRTSDYQNFVLQKLAVERATIITAQSLEMREIILSKFGRHLLNKIKIARFPPHDRLYEMIVEQKFNIKSSKREFSVKYNLDPDKKWIVIGHNGSPDNNHLNIIDALVDLPIHYKKEILFILPFSYMPAKSEKYIAQIITQLKKHELQGIVMRDFLPWTDLAILKSATDVMIHLPSSDALSGALTEAIFAGSRIITGAWLPYSVFARLGIKLNLIESFINLSEVLVKVVDLGRIDDYQLSNTREKIKNYFLSKPCAETWLNAFPRN
jgi:hypothetical protein